jgi:hypothetical protein
MKSYVFAVLALLSLPLFASDWTAQAQHDMGTPSGKQYEMVAAKYAASVLGQVMGTCVRSSLPSTFQLYLKLDAGGTVVASSVSPASPVADCFAGELSKLIWPKPPFAPFAYTMEMFGNEAGLGP